MGDFTRPTKPNTRIPPILLARKLQQQPTISTPSQPQPEQANATHIINLSQRKLSAESNNADPSLRRCLAHHRLLTRSIFEAKSDMRVYLDEVEYESDSEDEEDEDTVFDEHVEVVGMFQRDNDNVRVVDEESDAEAMLFHEEPTVHQEEIVLSHPNPPPGLPVPSSMAVTMPMSMSMPVPAYTPTSTASTLTHQPRSKISRPSFSSKIDPTSGTAPGQGRASNERTANPEPSAGGVSSDVTPYPASPSPSTTQVLDFAKTKEDDAMADTNTPPPRPPLSSVPIFTPIDRTSSAPTPNSAPKTPHPIKHKIVNTVKGLVKRRNSSPSCLSMPLVEPTTTSPTSAKPDTASPKPTEVPVAPDHADREEENRSPLLHLNTKNADCSSIPVRIKIQGDSARGSDTGVATKRSSSSAPLNPQRQSHDQMQSKSVAKRGRIYAQRLGERVGVAVPVRT